VGLDKVSEKLLTFLVKPDSAYRKETEEHIPKTKFSIPEENGREHGIRHLAKS
jgi:hypothetical protein